LLHWRLVDQSLAIFAYPVGTVFIPRNRYTGCFAALGAYEHDVRDIKRGFELYAARVDRAPLGLHLALMLGMDIYTLDNQPVFFWQNFNDFAAFPLVFQFSADDLNGITFPDLHSHRSLLTCPRALLGLVTQFS
jgi:hypothetical protein